MTASKGNGAKLIADERRRQIEVEGWTDEHDDEHGNGELIRVADLYIDAALICERAPQTEKIVRKMLSRRGVVPEENADFRSMLAHPVIHHYGGKVPSDWPWHPDWWKPSDDPIRNLVKAGALIAAEIDRLKRQEDT